MWGTVESIYQYMQGLLHGCVTSYSHTRSYSRILCSVVTVLEFLIILSLDLWFKKKSNEIMKHAVGTHRFSSCVVQLPPTSPGWVLIHQFSPLISWDAPFSCHCHSPSLMGVGHKHEKGQFWTHSPKYLRVEHGGSAVKCQHHGAPDEQFSGGQPFWCLLA